MDVAFQEPNSTDPDGNELRYFISESHSSGDRPRLPAPNSDERPPAPNDDADSFSIGDDADWDVFLPDDDEIDPLPEPGDFWFDDD